jgi:hypothetical protein
LIDKSTFENLGMRDKSADLSPQRLDFLTKVFDIVCEIYSIPLDALEEREALAIKIIVESRSIADEGKMLEAARKAAESYRQKSRRPSLSVVPSAVSSHKK